MCGDHKGESTCAGTRSGNSNEVKQTLRPNGCFFCAYLLTCLLFSRLTFVLHERTRLLYAHILLICILLIHHINAGMSGQYKRAWPPDRCLMPACYLAFYRSTMWQCAFSLSQYHISTCLHTPLICVMMRSTRLRPIVQHSLGVRSPVICATRSSHTLLATACGKCGNGNIWWRLPPTHIHIL